MIFTLVGETCCKCGTYFGIEERRRKELMDKGGSFFCTNGHEQHYTESTVKRLRRELKYTQNRKTELYNQLASVKRSRSAIKGSLTRLKNRIKQEESINEKTA